MHIIASNWVTSAEPWAVWSLAGVIAFFGCLFLWAFASYLRKVRLIEDTPTSKIRSAAQGFTELEGISRDLNPDNPLLSPLSQSACVWFDYRVQHRVVNSKNQASWQTVHSGRSSQPILLEDSTGTCLLKPAKASIHSNVNHTWYGDAAHPNRYSFENRNGFFQSGDYRYSEDLIRANQPLYALGHFRTTRSTDGFTREKAISNIIREWKSDYSKMLERFDRNGDGTLDEKEWKLVRLAAKLEAEDLENKLKQDADVHVMEKPSTNLPYLISTSNQEKFTKKLKWYYRIALVLTLVACYTASWIIYTRISGGL